MEKLALIVKSMFRGFTSEARLKMRRGFFGAIGVPTLQGRGTVSTDQGRPSWENDRPDRRRTGPFGREGSASLSLFRSQQGKLGAVIGKNEVLVAQGLSVVT